MLKWHPQGQQQLQQPQPCISIENVKKWIKLLALVQKANLVEKFVKNLLNCCWYLGDWPIYLHLESGSPIHVAAYTGDVGLMDLILHNNIHTDEEISLHRLQTNPLVVAATFGHVGVASLFLSKIDYPDKTKAGSLYVCSSTIWTT